MSNNSWGRVPGMAALSLPVILDLADCIANAITPPLTTEVCRALGRAHRLPPPRAQATRSMKEEFRYLPFR